MISILTKIIKYLFKAACLVALFVISITWQIILMGLKANPKLNRQDEQMKFQLSQKYPFRSKDKN